MQKEEKEEEEGVNKSLRKREGGIGETEEERVNSTLSKVAKKRKGK